MERIEIQMPDFFSFSTNIKIRITDLNYGGHAGNDVFLALVHEARYQFLLHHGYTELSFEGCGLISVCKKTLLLKHFTSVSSIKIVFDSSIFSKEVSNPEFSLIYPFFITSFCMCGT